MSHDFDIIQAQDDQGRGTILTIRDSEANNYRVIVAGLTILSSKYQKPNIIVIVMTARHLCVAHWRKQLYKFAIVEFIFRPIDEQRQMQLKKLSKSTMLKSKQFYIDLVLLLI